MTNWFLIDKLVFLHRRNEQWKIKYYQCDSWEKDTTYWCLANNNKSVQNQKL